MCQVASCLTENCRRIGHHMGGAPVNVTREIHHCPGCGKPNRERAARADIVAMNEQPDTKFDDNANSMGVTCGQCGFYFVPDFTPFALTGTAQPWEWPRGCGRAAA